MADKLTWPAYDNPVGNKGELAEGNNATGEAFSNRNSPGA
jgi:hypothetical protein